MDVSLITVIIGILIMPVIIIQIAKRIKDLQSVETSAEGAPKEVKLNTIFKISLFLCFLFIMIGVLYGTIHQSVGIHH